MTTFLQRHDVSTPSFADRRKSLSSPTSLAHRLLLFLAVMLMGVNCAWGEEVTEPITIGPVNYANKTYTITNGNYLSGTWNGGNTSAEIAGTSYSYCVKLESTTSLSFTTTKKFNVEFRFTGTRLKINGTATSDAVNNVLKVTLEAGEHKIERNSGTTNLYSIIFSDVDDSEKSSECDILSVTAGTSSTVKDTYTGIKTGDEEWNVTIPYGIEGEAGTGDNVGKQFFYLDYSVSNGATGSGNIKKSLDSAAGKTSSQDIIVTAEDGKTQKTWRITLVRGAAPGYTVSYNLNNHGEAIPDEVNATALPATFPTPTATGYDFKGWYTDEGLTNAAEAGVTISSNTTLYAKWTAQVYEIKYPGFDGTHGDNHPTRHTYGNATTLVNPTKDGYTFAGWYNNIDCTGSVITEIGAEQITANINLYAKWTENTETLNCTNNWWLNQSSRHALPTGQSMHLTFHNQSTNGNENFYNWILAAGTNVDGNTEYMALRADEYDIHNNGSNTTRIMKMNGVAVNWDTFKSDMSAGADVDIYVANSGSMLYVHAVTTAANGNKYDYTAETQTSAATAYISLMGEQCTLTNIKFYDPVTAYSVSATNGDNCTSAVMTNTLGMVVTNGTYVPSGEKITFTATPSDASNTFDGWKVDEEVKDTKNPTTIDVTFDIFVKAVYSLKPVTQYKITFNKNNGSGTMDAQMVAENVETAINENTFTREGYTFKEWNTKSDGTGTAYANKAQITLTANITLYAQWTKNVYTCTASVNDEAMGTATVNGGASASVEYNSTAKFVATPNNGYRFIKWTDASGTEVNTSASYSPKATSDLALTANFEEVPKVVTTKNTTWDLKDCGNSGTKSGSDNALYWNTAAGNVVDSSDDTNKLNGLKINSISDTYFIIPAGAKGLLTVTYGARYPNLETSIAVTGQSPVYTTEKATSVDFNIENTTGTNQEIHITRATSTSREGVITKIVWLPQRASNLQKRNDVEMQFGHEYVTTTLLTSGSSNHYSTSSKGALTYTSNNTDIVTVDANGLITAHKVGIATITINQAETFGYKAGSCEVTVNVNDLYASTNALEVQVGSNKNVTLESSSTGTYTVTSDKTGIATASVSGNTITINGVADGEATITVTQAAETGYSAATITINVSVYTSKTYYDADNGNLKFEEGVIKDAAYMKLGGIGFGKKSYNYEGENQKDKQIYGIKTTAHTMKINVKNAAAFEIFAVGGTGRAYYMNVDGVNVGMVAAENGTTSSGVFPCEKTGSTITLTGSGDDVYPAYIKFYDILPTIIKVDGRSGFDNVTRFVDGGVVSFPVATNNESSPMTLTGVNSEIAEVTLANGTLTVNPVKAGTFTMTLAQAAVGETQTAGSRDIKVNIKKHNITFTYDKPIISVDRNANSEATLDDVANLTCTLDGVATALNALPSDVTVTYDSDDLNVATVTDAGVVSLVSNAQGTAAITASIAENPTYEATDGQHKIAVIDGYNFKMNAAGTVSKINELYPIYGEGEEDADNILTGIYYGGWKYGNHSYVGVSDADEWPKSKIYSRAGSAEKIYIDDYQQQTQANNDARSENKVPFEIGKPFSLPVRGAYMKFDAERTGVLTAYFVQNGDLTYSGETLSQGFARRSYFITDEFGNIVTPISAMSKEKLPAQSDVINKSCGGNTADYPNYAKALADKELTPEGKFVNWTWSTTERQPVLYDEETHGYHVLQKAYVKYVFNVEAGKSYYVFSSASKIGFAGANFQVDDATELYKKEINHEPKLELDQTATYVAPEKKTWYDEVTLNRSFNAGEWSTIVLPFSLSEAKVKEIFGDDVQLTVFNGVNGFTANLFYHVNQNIIAGYPYIILPSKNVESIEVKNVTIDPEVSQYVFSNITEGGHSSWVSGGEYIFKGLDGYSKSGSVPDIKETMCKYSYYVSSDGLHRTTSGTLTCNGYRAYLKYTGTSSSPAKIATMSIGGIEEELDENVSTEIMIALDAEDMYEPASGIGVYNLNGQKVANSTKGLPSGIYIVNGKKKIVNK